MITSNISTVGFKKSYSLFILTGLFLLFVTFLVPQKASAQAYVPVKDAALIAAFNAFLASVGGGTYIDPATGDPYIDPTTGNPVEIATEVCSTTTLPGSDDGTNWYSDKKDYFGIDLDGNGKIEGDEIGVYKEDYVFADRDGDGTKEWNFEPVTQGGDVYYTRSRVDPARNPKQEDPSQADYYTDPKNPYFFLPNPDEMSPSHVGINNSKSLNCLLQEMVEWEKLQINMQMHSMVKEYFTDAQTYMLSQQLLGTLAAATIEWSNKELVQVSYVDGVRVEDKGPIYGDVDNVAMGIANSELSGGLDEITGGAVAGNDLGLNPARQADIAKNVNDNLRERDSFSELEGLVNYTPPPAGNNAEEAYLHAARNSALNVTSFIESNIAQRMTQAADKQKDQWEAYGGYLSVLDCGADPFCRDPQTVTPGNILSKNLSDATGVGIEGTKGADEIGEGASPSAQELTYQLQQQSLRDYTVQDLLSNEQTPRELFNEFEFVLTNYYGINEGTTHWSRNMLINTWDDIMWGSGAPGKAEDLGNRLKDIKATVSP